MESTSHAQPSSSRASWITPAILLALAGVFVLFAFKATDTDHSTWFGIFKLVHVALAVFWVGGGVALTALGLRAERSNDPNEMATIARQAAFVGEKLFAPASGVLLLMGIVMVINRHIGFGTTWVSIGLTIWAISFVVGIGVLSPLAKRIAELIETAGPEAPATQAAIRKILFIARFDVALLLVAVADMLMKPFS